VLQSLRGTGHEGSLLVALHLAAVTLAAFLLGWLELLVGRAILPQLGGTPAVWNTCLLFFQATILAGYAYAHLVSKLRPKLQSAVHAVVLLAPLPMLPFAFGAMPAASASDGALALIFRILLLLALVTGPAALAVSASAPLFQRWFSRSVERDPYFLYAGSNLGTLLGIIGFPLVIEPLFSLRDQARMWAFGDALLVVLALACAIVAAKSRPEPPTAPARRHPLMPQWFLLSFIPCSLLHGVTTAITTDVAAVPLLWSIPLAIYLGTFALAFLPRAPLPQARLESLLLLWLATTVGVSLLAPPLPTLLLLVLHLGGFAGVAWALHRRLAAARPEPAELTSFYLVVSLGGLCGGVFNALTAPVLFDTTLEYRDAGARGPRARRRRTDTADAHRHPRGDPHRGLQDARPRRAPARDGGARAARRACVRAFTPRRGASWVAAALVLLIGQFSLVAMACRCGWSAASSPCTAWCATRSAAG